MVGLISLGHIDINIIFPIFSGLSPVIYSNLLRKAKAKFINYDFIFTFISSLSMSISLIPFLISKTISNSRQNSNNVKEFNKYKKFLFIILAMLFDLGITMMIIFLTFSNISVWFLDFIIISLFSRFILKTNIHRHHYFCIVVIIICGVGLNSIQSLNFKENFIDIFKDVLLEMCKSFSFVLEKYVMDYQFCSPYELCFYIGFFEMIIIGICHIFFYFFKNKYINDLKEYYKIVNFKEICIIIILLFLNFIYNLMLLIAIKKYNAFCSLIIIVIYEIGLAFFKINKAWEFCVLTIIAVISLFISLIFNEIIEINCFGLQNKTKKNLEKIAQIELRVKSDFSDDSVNQVDIGDYKYELGSNSFHSRENNSLIKLNSFKDSLIY